MKKIILYILLLFTFFNVNAQNIDVSARLDSNKIIIGQQTKILLKATIFANQNIQFPILIDTIIEGVEVIEIGKIDTVFTKGNEKQLLSQEITVTSFDSGGYVLPPFVFFNENKDSLLTNELLLKVNTFAVDTAEAALKDIHNVYDTPMTFKEFIQEYKYWLLGGLALIIAAVLLFMYFKYWKEEKTIEVIKKPKKIIPAHIIATKKLEQLKEEKLWQAGKVKKYYTDLTDILREYIENRYKISTGEQTSTEILDACSTISSLEE